jgi:hypothetical protein
VIALVKTSLGGPGLRSPLVRGMQLVGTIDYAIEFSNGQLVVSVNGNSQSFVFDHSRTGNNVGGFKGEVQQGV